MALGAALTMVLGSAWWVASCSGKTLNASWHYEDSLEAMLADLKTTASQIMPGVNPTEVMPRVGNAFERLSDIYGGEAMQAHSIQVNREEIHQDFTAKHQSRDAAIYGELLPPSVAAMLQFAVKNNPNIVWDGKEHYRYEVHAGSGDDRPKFVDLGSGFGKVSMLAALLGFDARGYELAHPRILEACRALDRLAVRNSASVAPEHCDLAAGQNHGNLKFFFGSFTDQSVNIQDADVIFTDSVFWTPEMMSILGEKASQMKPGSIIVSYKEFPGDSFVKFPPMSLPASWSGSTEWQVQQVLKKGQNLRGSSSS
jgi:hypothetical protein